MSCVQRNGWVFFLGVSDLVGFAKMLDHPLGVVWVLCLDNTDVWADAIWGLENKTGCGGAALGIQSGDPRIQEENGKWSECNQSKRTVSEMTKDNGREVKAVPPAHWCWRSIRTQRDW